jgi:hypothetical protein
MISFITTERIWTVSRALCTYSQAQRYCASSKAQAHRSILRNTKWEDIQSMTHEDVQQDMEAKGAPLVIGALEAICGHPWRHRVRRERCFIVQLYLFLCNLFRNRRVGKSLSVASWISRRRERACPRARRRMELLGGAPRKGGHSPPSKRPQPPLQRLLRCQTQRRVAVMGRQPKKKIPNRLSCLKHQIPPRIVNFPSQRDPLAEGLTRSRHVTAVAAANQH